MLIRSQDKKILINFNQIQSLGIYTKKDKSCEIFVNNYPIIAQYSTEEKAIKILDMIQEEYKKCNIVFQMPLDEEVEV